MTSNDKQQYITFEVYNSGNNELKAYIHSENEKTRGEIKELKPEIQAVRDIALTNSVKIEMLQHTFYWGLGIMTVVIAVIATIAPYFYRERKEQKKIMDVMTRAEVQEMINASIPQAINEAIAKVFMNFGNIPK